MTLRIDKHSKCEWVLVSLTGRIQADRIPELQQLLTLEMAGHPVVLDLQEVRLVDREVVRFLALNERDGVTLKNCPPFIREWISQERIGFENAQPTDSTSSRVRS